MELIPRQSQQQKSADTQKGVMTSQQRLRKTLNHEPVDRVCLSFPDIRCDVRGFDDIRLDMGA